MSQNCQVAIYHKCTVSLLFNLYGLMYSHYISTYTYICLLYLYFITIFINCFRLKRGEFCKHETPEIE